MSGWKKLAAASAAGGGVDVDEVFSTYLYTGNASTQTITNDIDLSGKGGLVWTKNRSATAHHRLFDTERGVNKGLGSNITNAEVTLANSVTAFNSNGFSLGSSTVSNTSGKDYASWTFRKAPKFFDVVTYTGNGTNGRTISHNLGSAPGCIIVKDRSYNSNWKVYHRGIGETKWLNLNNNSTAQTGNENWYDTAPTSSVFTVGSQANNSGSNFVAYLFAHNDGDGEFGPDGDQDIIKCGSYTGNSQGEYNDNGVEVNLGFEPQWVLIKSSTWSGDWQIYDAMRGITARPTTSSRDGDDAGLFPNQSYAENGASSFLRVTPTGFKLESDNYDVNNNFNYIYMAIRRGPLAVPESATDVFAIDTGAGTGTPMFGSSFPVDFAMQALPYTSAHDKRLSARLTGIGYGNVEGSPWYTDSNMNWDYMDGYYSVASNQSTWISWMWKRAPGFCDVVAYTGDGTANQTFNHGLTVKPGMIWLKNRSRTSTDWWCWVDDSITTLEGRLNSSDDFGYNVIGTVTDTTVQTLYTNQYATNYNGDKYIAYLFATLDGISKCGSYTGDGTSNSSKVINCGFTSGARFVIIKSVDGEANNWFMFDTERGIVAGNDSGLKIDRPNAANSLDYVDPHNSGFIVGCASNTVNAINVSGVKYMFYAVA